MDAVDLLRKTKHQENIEQLKLIARDISNLGKNQKRKAKSSVISNVIIPSSNCFVQIF